MRTRLVRILGALALACGLPASAMAQTAPLVSDTITALNDFVAVRVTSRVDDNDIVSIGITIAGTFDGTVTFGEAADLTCTSPTTIRTLNTARSLVATATAPGLFVLENAGYRVICITATTWNSGTMSVVVTRGFAPPVGAGSGGGGSFDGVLVDAAGGDPVTDTVNNAIKVNVVAGAGSGGTAAADNSAFTFGTTNLTPVGFVFDDTSPNAATENRTAAPRMSGNRVAYSMLRDAAGNERGANVNASNQLEIAGPVSQSGAWNVTNISGTVSLPTGASTAANQSTLNAAFGTTAAAADNTANPTAGALRGFTHIFDGATWDRWTGAVSQSGTWNTNLFYGGSAAATGAGVVGATVGRFTLASDDPAVTRLINIEQKLTDIDNSMVDDAEDLATALTSGPQNKLKITTSLAAQTPGSNGTTNSALSDDMGRNITINGCPRQDRVSNAVVLTNTTSTSLLSAPGASIYHEVYAIEVVNNSTTDTYVEIEDGSDGTIKWYLAAPATTDTIGGNNRVFTVPLSTFTANTAIFVDLNDTPSGGDANVLVSILACKVK